MNTKESFVRIIDVVKKADIPFDEIIMKAMANEFSLYIYIADARYNVVEGDFAAEYRHYSNEFLKISTKAIRTAFYNSPEKKLPDSYLDSCYDEESSSETYWKGLPKDIKLDQLLMNEKDLQLFGFSFTYDNDFKNISVNGVSYSLNPNDAMIIKFLYEMHQQGFPRQTNSEILQGVSNDVKINENKMSKHFLEDHILRKIGFLKTEKKNGNSYYYFLNLK